jgi:hypothetical protein
MDIEQLYEDVKIIDDSDISSMLEVWREIAMLRSRVNQLDEMLKDKVRAYMKERSWNRYMDPNNNISVAITKIQKKRIDEKQLKHFLTAGQLAQIYVSSEFERLDIVTPEARKKLKSIIRGR